VSVRVAYEALRRVAPRDQAAPGIELRRSAVVGHVADQSHLVDRDPFVSQRHLQRRRLTGQVVLLVVDLDVENTLSRARGKRGRGFGRRRGHLNGRRRVRHYRHMR